MKYAEQQGIKEQILHVLKVYPGISPSMLQVGIGSHVKPAKWKPILAKLVDAKTVVRIERAFQTPSNNHRTYVKLVLHP